MSGTEEAGRSEYGPVDKVPFTIDHLLDLLVDLRSEVARMSVGYPCAHESHSGIGDDLWKCDICGEVVRYVDDPDGDIWMTTLDPYANRKVRTEVVTPGDGRRMDAAGTPVATCSGRHHNNWCTTCGHDPGDHNEELICLVCHQLCDYCGTFSYQHTDTEWTSCQRDLEAVENRRV